MSSEKQRGYLASLIKQYHEEYPTLTAIWNATPKNNEKHNDVRVDSRELILADNLAPLTKHQASYVIGWFKGATDQYGKKMRTSYALRFLTNLGLVEDEEEKCDHCGHTPQTGACFYCKMD